MKLWFWRRGQRESDLQAEIRGHLDMASTDKVAEGQSAAEAALAAKREFGNVALISELTREAWGGGAFERLARDARLAVRSLRRAPTFALTAMMVLGLGIGLAVAMFTVFEAVLLRPLPVVDQDRVVLLQTVDGSGVDIALQPRELEQLGRESHTLSRVAGVAHQGAFDFALSHDDRALTLKMAWVTSNFFTVLGTRPSLGRFFAGEDSTWVMGSGTAPPMAPALILSYQTWQREFGGDSAILGAVLTDPYLRRRHTVVGVAPPGLAYPPGVECWEAVGYPGMNVVARLAPDATPRTARAEYLTLIPRIQDLQPDRPGLRFGAEIAALPDVILGEVRPVLRALAAAVALLLAIACLNVVNLLVIRSGGRAREIAIRRALGASGHDVARQLLVENGIVAILGGTFGLCVAWLAIRAFPFVAPAELPRTDLLSVQGMPLGIASAVLLLTVLVVGTLPLVVRSQRDLTVPLGSDLRAGTRTRSQRRLRRVLVLSQVAIALVMVASSGLLARSFAKLAALDLGFSTRHLTLVTVARPVTEQDGPVKLAALLHSLPPALRAVSGVDAVTSLAVSPFFGPQVFTAAWVAEGQASADHVMMPIEAGGPEYFRALGIPLTQGRGFAEADSENAPRVAVVSQRAARVFWPGQDPIGRRIRFASDTTRNAWRTVVGVAGDIHYRRLREASPTVYLPSSQYFFQGLFALRTSRDIETMLPRVEAVIRTVDADARLSRLQKMDDLVSKQLALPKVATLVITAFGCAALLLAAVGLFGVMAAMVQERTRELGIRAALGATPGRLLRGVLREAVGLTGIGVAVGLGIAFAATRLLRSLLFDVSPVDPVAFGCACAVLLIVSLAAALVPATTATRIAPAIVLRSE